MLRYINQSLYIHNYALTTHLFFFLCFLSAGSPAFSPSKSRLVEALLIQICDRHPNPVRGKVGGARQYTSRWKQILSDYAALRSRLFNSQPLLEDTGIFLYSINETTLKNWYKQVHRKNEVRQLLQGTKLPQREVSQGHLPLKEPSISIPPPPPHPYVHREPEDTTGQAKVRKSPLTRQQVPSASHATTIVQAQVPSLSHASSIQQQVPSASHASSTQQQVPSASHATILGQPQVPSLSHASSTQQQVHSASHATILGQPQVPSLSHASSTQQQVPSASHASSTQQQVPSASHASSTQQQVPSASHRHATTLVQQQVPSVAGLSRTTKWRRAKNPQAQKRKAYQCQHCGGPIAGKTLFFNLPLHYNNLFTFQLQATLKREGINIVLICQARSV